MARKSTIQEPKPAEITPEKIRSGIVKLTRRIEELKTFDVLAIQKRWDPKTEALTTKINDTIAEIFSYDTIEYKEYKIFTLDTLPIYVGGGEDPLDEVQEGYKKGIEAAIIKLSSLKETLEEKVKDIDENVGTAILPINFWNEIHPKITSVAKSRFESTHYADAVESALKEINSCVKDIFRRKTGKELDGAPLMFEVFSPKSPIIVLDDLSTESGRNIQQGYMEIFAGAMIGIRNPKAHDNINITENRAKHFIYLASLLMYKIDERI
jgi:uncharacterized protein (TIGR02391 family)